ncbi:hypothetical protein [Kibdelosporangium philippinense]|uniref:hypothetical protein n=1 Tax=Kibdelosporangium philippinense TaxID=211113 RepID=UPI003605DD6F
MVARRLIALRVRRDAHAGSSRTVIRVIRPAQARANSRGKVPARTGTETPATGTRLVSGRRHHAKDPLVWSFRRGGRLYVTIATKRESPLLLSDNTAFRHRHAVLSRPGAPHATRWAAPR